MITIKESSSMQTVRKSEAITINLLGKFEKMKIVRK